MKVLFLDIDGPLVITDNPQDTQFGRMNVFDERCVAALNDIWRFTQCEIVVSSDWSLNNFDGKLQVARNVFKYNNVQAPIIGFIRKRRTRNSSDLEKDRTLEILEWVDTHNPELWVAVDDLELRKLGNEHFVLVDPIEGLNSTGLKDLVIALLS
jgi:hypothetical protein